MEKSACSQCPSEVELSTYYDLSRLGDCTSPLVVRLRDHVEHCPRCRSTIASYGRLEELLSSSFAAPSDLSERIKAGCRRAASSGESHEPAYLRPVSAWWVRPLRYAAAAVLGVGVLAGLWVGVVDSPQSSPVEVAQATVSPSGPVDNLVRSTTVLSESSEPAASSQVPSLSSVGSSSSAHSSRGAVSGSSRLNSSPLVAVRNPSPVDFSGGVIMKSGSVAPSVFNSGVETLPHDMLSSVVSASEPLLPVSSPVQSQDVTLVGIGSRGKAFRGEARAPRYLGEAVRHIWMVDDLSAARLRSVFDASLSGKKGVTVSYANREPNRMIVHIDGLDDRSLQHLVEDLDRRAKWALVSPMLPQPGQTKSVAFNGHPVSYTVWAIQKDK